MTAHETTKLTVSLEVAAPNVSSSLLTTSLGCLLYVLDFFVTVVGGCVLVVVVDAMDGGVLGVVTGHHRETGGVGTGVVGAAAPHTLNTIFMLCEMQRPPVRRCRSSLVDVEMK